LGQETLSGAAAPLPRIKEGNGIDHIIVAMRLSNQPSRIPIGRLLF
jgi:hypothetical protein